MNAQQNVPKSEVATAAERDRYREALSRIANGGYPGASFVAQQALLPVDAAAQAKREAEIAKVADGLSAARSWG